MSRILIIEDESAIRRVLVKILTEENSQYQVFEAEDGLTGTEMIKKDDFDLVLCDIKMPKMDGVEVLEAVKKIKPEIPMVMISGHGDLDTAVNTMRLGAFDYISKPPDLNRLLNTIRNALDRKQLVVENKRLKRKVSKQYEMIGNTPEIASIKSIIDKVAPTEARVLVTGPNGTGKSTIFNLITGLIKPDHGSIKFNNIEAVDLPIYLRTKKFKIGYCPQNGGYFSEMTLSENLRAVAEIIIPKKNLIEEKIKELIAKFELDAVRDIRAKFLSGGQKKKLVIALSLLSNPSVLLLDECFAALDVLTIKMLQEIIINLQQENLITVCICDHQARDLLACVDVAMILNNGKIVAQDTPSKLVKDINAKNVYFGESFKFN